MMRIVERFCENNGSWTVRIANAAETRSAFLNFSIEPTDAEVRAVFQIMLDSEQAAQAAQEVERATEESNKVTLRDAIAKYEA